MIYHPFLGFLLPLLAVIFEVVGAALLFLELLLGLVDNGMPVFVLYILVCLAGSLFFDGGFELYDLYLFLDELLVFK